MPYRKEPDHDVFAQLTLSGTPITVGLMAARAGEAIFFQTDDNPEPVYITDQEAELLIAALRVAQCEIRKLGARVE